MQLYYLPLFKSGLPADSRCVPIVLIKAFIGEVPCRSLLVAAGFVLNAICPLEYFSNMTVMVEIVSRRVEFSCALSVFVCKSVS